MGVILDSGVLIARERKGNNARQALAALTPHLAGQDLALSAITLLELMHGAVRADSPARVTARRQFVHELAATLPVHPMTISVALRAGHLDGENASKGVRLALADLLIGVTALELGYHVATSNLRHFDRIPGLSVLPL